jgi:hypothetical protein
MMAVLLSVVALGAFYVSSTQAVLIVRVGKENVHASQLLQERMEAFRAAPAWTDVTTAAGIAKLVAAPTSTAANFPKVTETYTVRTYYPVPAPPAPAPLRVSRGWSGTFTSAGTAPVATSAIMVTIQADWVGANKIARSRQLATIISKNGVK